MDFMQHIEGISEEVAQIASDTDLTDDEGTGLEKGFSSSVPWNQTTPWANKNDFDFDGIPDSLDNNFGAGAFN